MRDARLSEGEEWRKVHQDLTAGQTSVHPCRRVGHSHLVHHRTQHRFVTNHLVIDLDVEISVIPVVWRTRKVAADGVVFLLESVPFVRDPKHVPRR